MTTTHVVDDWAQTQSIGLAGQLDCGARSFDYRPYLKDDGELYAHHGMQTNNFIENQNDMFIL
jgi:hypothetical protein